MTQDDLCTIELRASRMDDEFKARLINAAEDLEAAVESYDYDRDVILGAAELLRRVARED